MLHQKYKPFFQASLGSIIYITHLHGATLPSDPPVLSSMKAFYSHQSFPSACEPALPPSQPVTQRSALFLVPCAVVYTQPRRAVGPLLSLGNWRDFLPTLSFKISLCQSKTGLYRDSFTVLFSLHKLFMFGRRLATN